MDLGGLQRIVNLLIQRIDKDRFIPYVCCLDRGGMFYEQLKQDIQNKYILEREAGPFDLKVLRKLIRILKDNKIDIIHSHNGCSFYAALAGKMAGVKGIVHTDHGRLIPDRPAAIWEDRIASYMMSSFVGVSNELTKYLASTVKVRRKILATVINGVDTLKYVPISDEEKRKRRVQYGLEINNNIICTVCRLDPVKNLDMLIDCVPNILNRIPDCKFVIIGDGSEEARLKKRVSKLNLNSKIIFYGRVGYIDKILPVFDLYVNTSLSEGTSMTILEAMSCGLPIVAADVGGNNAMVDGSNGILFPSDQADAFLDSVIKILGNKDMIKKMGDRSREIVQSKFSIEHVVEQYENIYRKLV